MALIGSAKTIVDFLHVKARYDQSLKKGDNCSTRVVSNSITAGLSLEEQIHPRKENPTCVDHSPYVKVVSDDSICNISLTVNIGLPPEAVGNIVTNCDKGYFKLKKSDKGMEKFEGCWKMEPIFVDEHLCFPFKPTSVKDYVSHTKGKRRIASLGRKIMVDSVFIEAAEIKEREDLPSSGTCIKERWALRRKFARNGHRK